MGDLSAHFSRQELACPCGGRLQLEDKLLAALEKLRSLAKRPVLVHDGYRCPKHNREVGGVPGSEHTRGCAADIALPETSLQHMYELALEVPEFRGGGIGVYEGAGPWTSVPVRRAGLAIWRDSTPGAGTRCARRNKYRDARGQSRCGISCDVVVTTPGPMD